MRYSAWELNLLQGLQKLHNPLLNKIMIFITGLGDRGMIWIIIAIIMLFTKKYRKTGIIVALSLLFSIITGNVILKNLVARARPSFLFTNYDVLIKAPLSYAFPSGHTQSSFAAAFSIFLVNQKEGIAAMLLAFAIAFSRLYLFVHWPTDVLGGMVFGLICAAISYIAVNVIKNTLFKKKSD